MRRPALSLLLIALAAIAAFGVHALQPRLPAGALSPDAPVAGTQLGMQEAEDMTCSVLQAQANDDYWTTSKNTSITRSPLENDPDNELQNFGGMGQPSHGTTEQVGIDAVKYTPDTGFTGSDSFNYVHVGCLQCFGGGCSEPDYDLGTVYVTVTN